MGRALMKAKVRPFIRMPADSPDVPGAVAEAIERSADYVGSAQRGERVLLAPLHLGAAESRIVVESIVDLVRAGKLLLIYAPAKPLSYDKAGPYLIAPSEAAPWPIMEAA
jgi:hypothetical protein